MNAEEFVKLIEQVVLRPVVDDCLSIYEDPPGRKPSAELLELSNWYMHLPESDKTKVAKLMNDSAQSVLFGIFCVLDGVRAIEGAEEKGTLELSYISRSGERHILNSIQDKYLHDLLKPL